MIKVYKKSQTTSYPHFKEMILYSIIYITEDKFSIFLEYSSIEKEEDVKRLKQDIQDQKQFLYPAKYLFVKTENIYQMVQKYVELQENYKELYLCIPQIYPFIDCEFVEDSKNVPESIIDDLKKQNSLFPYVVVGEKYEKFEFETPYNYYSIFCCKCKKLHQSNIFVNETVICPECKNKEYVSSYKKKFQKIIVMDEFKKFREEQFGLKGKKVSKYSPECKNAFSNLSNCIKNQFIYVARHPEDSNGVIVYNICYSITATKGKITSKYEILSSIEHIPGRKTIAYKHLKNGKKETNPFSIININSKNIHDMENILYEDAENFFDFAINNQNFIKRSGFLAALKYKPSFIKYTESNKIRRNIEDVTTMSISISSFFITFICIVNKYPIIEQIIKMGHAKLFFNLYESMLSASSKDVITNNVEKINELINPESAGGKSALRFPVYIGDYLIQKNASYEEYFYWMNIYELTKLSKEQFYNFTESFEYSMVNALAELHDIGNILKFGHGIQKLFSYIIKTSMKTEMDIKEVIQYMSDYMNMCDMLGVTIEMYPQDLKKQHDDISVIFKHRKNKEYDNILTIIADECEQYVVPKEDELDSIGIPELFKIMTVIFPKNEKSFIDEGNQQHNCVGSYPENVRKGRTVVFFVRYKNNPNKSFITAECTTHGLGQCMYSNNRIVSDEKILKFAKYVSNKICTGVKSGKIHALSKVAKSSF